VEGIETGELQRRRPEKFVLLGRPASPERRRSLLSSKFMELWDGIRRLPFSDHQVAVCMARFACFAIWKSGERRLMAEQVNVEFGASDGSYAQAVIDQRRLRDAFRPDLQTIVKDTYFGQIQEKPIAALLWIPEPQLLFSFEAFVDLLIYDVLPSQMCRPSSLRGRFFSPWRISGFGLR
jgi:hypothetical protein